MIIKYLLSWNDDPQEDWKDFLNVNVLRASIVASPPLDNWQDDIKSDIRCKNSEYIRNTNNKWYKWNTQRGYSQKSITTIDKELTSASSHESREAWSFGNSLMPCKQPLTTTGTHSSCLGARYTHPRILRESSLFVTFVDLIFVLFWNKMFQISFIIFILYDKFIWFNKKPSLLSAFHSSLSSQIYYIIIFYIMIKSLIWNESI
jgi:hypothetical protein